MRFLFQLLLIVLLGYLVSFFMPWYGYVFIAFAVGWLMPSRFNFLAGFLGAALLWGGQIWMIQLSSSSDLPERVARVFSLQEAWWLVAVTLLLGGLAGGFACMTGGFLHRKKRQGYYA